MRYAKLAIALLGFAAVLVAADPFVGTWKLNTAKSKYKTGNAPKEQTLTVTEEGGDLHVMMKGTASDGTPLSTHYSMPAAGGKGKVIESTYDGVEAKRLNETQRETMYSKGGKVVYTAKAKVSGNSLTVNVKGTTVNGQAVEGNAVYDKQ